MIRRDALIDELKRVSEIAGRSPTEQDMLEHGEFAYSTYFRYFESWTRAKEIAGVDDPSDNKISDDELLAELNRVNELVEGSPTKRQVDRFGEYPSSTYKYRFGSWNETLTAADLPLNEGGNEEYYSWYGPKWEGYRKAALERDEYRCRLCERGPESLDNSLHVHHIRPLREFVQDDDKIDYKQAHTLDNLVSLCPSCHQSHEGKYQGCSPERFVEQIKSSHN